MKTSLGQMDGNAWEEYCQKLLRIRHQDYQKVPARFGGDLGVEGFTFSGLVFQCYCPDDNPFGKDLYEKQRAKITRDISKLIRHADKISALGAGVIKEWHFLTPDYDSRDLVAHCRSKESEVRIKGLPAIHCDFRIMLKTDDDYIPERQTYLGAGGLRIQPSRDEPLLEELEEFLTSENEIVLNIKTKLGKLSLASGERASLTRELVTGYVVGRDELETINEKFPSMYSSVVHLKSARESQLKIRTLSCLDKHGTILFEILKEYEEKLNSEFSNSLSSALIARLSMEAISDWLGRCPLDFPNLEDNNENH